MRGWVGVYGANIKKSGGIGEWGHTKYGTVGAKNERVQKEMPKKEGHNKQRR